MTICKSSYLFLCWFQFFCGIFTPFFRGDDQPPNRDTDPTTETPSIHTEPRDALGASKTSRKNAP